MREAAAESVLPRGPVIVAAGDNVVDCYASFGVMYPGGNALNVAVFAVREGATSAYVGQVGDDPAGHHIANALAREGVGTSGLRVVAGGETAHCVIGHVDGDRVFVSSAKGVSEFELAAADFELAASADAVHLSISSGLDTQIAELAALARVSYDFGPQRDTAEIASVAPHLFLATFSGADLADDSVVQLMERVTSLGARYVLVTQGARGAMLGLVGPEGLITWSTHAAQAEVVDTLGAGDTFVARTLLGLLRDEAPESLLAAAAEAAAATCQRVGAFGESLPISEHQPKFSTPIHDKIEDLIS